MHLSHYGRKVAATFLVLEEEEEEEEEFIFRTKTKQTKLL